MEEVGEMAGRGGRSPWQVSTHGAGHRSRFPGCEKSPAIQKPVLVQIGSKSKHSHLQELLIPCSWSLPSAAVVAAGPRAATPEPVGSGQAWTLPLHEAAWRSISPCWDVGKPQPQEVWNEAFRAERAGIF